MDELEKTVSLTNVAIPKRKQEWTQSKIEFEFTNMM